MAHWLIPTRQRQRNSTADSAVRQRVRPEIASSIPLSDDVGRVIGVPPEECSSQISWLFDYWRGIHPTEGGLPGRQHLEPVDLYPLWRWLWLIDVQRDPLRFKFRLIGTGHGVLLKGDYTGQWIDEALPILIDTPVFDGLRTAAAGLASYCRSRIILRYGDDAEPSLNDDLAEWLFLPFARDGETPDMALVLCRLPERFG